MCGSCVVLCCVALLNRTVWWCRICGLVPEARDIQYISEAREAVQQRLREIARQLTEVDEVKAAKEAELRAMTSQ